MKRLTIEQKKRLSGMIFLIPWLVGLAVFFIQPLIQTIRFSVGELYINPTQGYYIKPLDNGIFGQFIRAFTQDADYVRYLTEAIQKLIYEVPVIVVFALVIAMILNQKFKGRTFMRTVFFLPVIITSGIIVVTLKTGLNGVAVGGNPEAANIFSSAGIHKLLIASDLPYQAADFISTAINNVVDTVWRAGVQILLYMSALLSIPKTYYEVAEVEGSTAWESFWKITFPIIMPIMMINVIYTIVDSLSSYSNSVMRHISNVTTRELSISYGSALYWIYFAVVLVILGVTYLIFSRSAHYEA